MKAKLLCVAVALVALATASPALADGSGGSGGAQAGAQNASTNQGALGIAASNQNAVNANVPVSIAGGNVSAGPSTANQNATSTATADVSNKAKTDQDQYLTQNVGGPSGCYAGCGGSGGFQAGVQNAQTNQLAIGAAISKQNAVNANVPVSIAGGNVSAGPSTANQNATSTATTDVSNKAKTDQDQGLKQNVGSGCGCDSKGSDPKGSSSNGSSAGSGGDGGFQAGVQNAETNQGALGAAVSKQNAVNANVPVSIAGGNVNSGPSTASQNATSTATTDVSNKAKTDQDQWQKQNIGSGCGCDSKGSNDPKGYDPSSSDHSSGGCVAGCGGAGGFQLGVQNAETNQFAAGLSKSDQNAVNANVPVSIAGGNVSSGPSTANQNATSTATTDVSNRAKTDQDQGLTQNVGGSSSCLAGCGGSGGFQLGVQKADTNQWAAGAAFSNQNAVNSNTPVSIAGGNVSSGPSTANQNATSTATTDVSNKAKTDQDQYLTQNVGSGCGCDSKGSYDPKGSSDHNSGCIAGCGGSGGFQLGIQDASTNQGALGISASNQNAVNGNSPASTAGGNISSGPSTANQNATSTATTDVSNRAKTDQDQHLTQNVGGSGSCKFGCGGDGGFQAGIQSAYTNQGALGISYSDQNAVNGNSPASTAGGNISSGPSTANQNATSTATTDVSNRAKTDQDQSLKQNIGSGCGCDSKGSYDPRGYGSSSDHSSGGCAAGCGGDGGFQLGVQNAETNQWAAGIALSNQNAVNGNSPASTAGGNISSGPSTANQNATSTATADVSNKAKTDQDQHLRQNIDSGCGCDSKGHDPKGSYDSGSSAGSGGDGGFQVGLQNAETNQWAAGIALSYQNAVNGNSPASTAGGNIYSGPSTANQNATSTGYTDTSNRAKTDQDQGQSQSIGKSCGDKCGPTGIRSDAPNHYGGAIYSDAPASQVGNQSTSGDAKNSREQQPIWQS
jgi:hypothetical protein